MNTNIRILFYTFTHTELKVLSNSQDHFDIPSLNLESLDTTKTVVGMNHALKKIHTQYTNISFEWAKYKFLDIDLYQNIDNRLFMDIYYCVFLPAEVHNSRGHWLNIIDLVAQYPILRKMSYYV